MIDRYLFVSYNYLITVVSYLFVLYKYRMCIIDHDHSTSDLLCQQIPCIIWTIHKILNLNIFHSTELVTKGRHNVIINISKWTIWNTGKYHAMFIPGT